MAKEVVPKCAVDGCTANGNVLGYCCKHYDKLDRSVRQKLVSGAHSRQHDPLDILCKFEGCRTIALVGDLCRKHASKRVRVRTLKPKCPCGKRVLGKLGYCATCWDKMHYVKQVCACGRRANVTGLCSKCRKPVDK